MNSARPAGARCTRFRRVKAEHEPAPDITARGGSPCPEERIVQAAIRLYRAIGYRKTTVADIARSASMSPANLYRFFPSRQAVEESVVAGLLDEVYTAAGSAARSGVSDWSAWRRLFGRSPSGMNIGSCTMSGCMNWSLPQDKRIGRSPCPTPRGSADLVRSIIAAGQASGDFRAGSAMELANCVLEAMDAYLDPSRINAIVVRPTFDEMMSFCAGALRDAAHAQATGPRLSHRAPCRA